ncbi:MAG: glycine cleavage system aminomethyltransferase GcvT [Dehalococcoidia bacterium]
MVTEPLRRTPLYDRHVALGGRMVPFAGWEMPVQYSGIVEESRAVRQRAGLFDVSHMGRVFLTGPNAVDLLRRVLTFNVRTLAEGQSHYSLLCDESGGILDDPYLFRLGEERWMLIPNAARVEADLEHIRAHVAPDWDVRIDDRQAQTAMLALQGPGAKHVFGAALSREIEERLARRHQTEIQLYGYKAVVSRTGYTGEDGFEFIAAIDAGVHLWDTLIELGVMPCGLGARDTLRLEASLALYGQDITTDTDPFEAGLGWVVSLDDQNFVGRAALLNRKVAVTHRLVCFTASARGGLIRHGYALLDGDTAIGQTTSGGFSPTLNTSIGMGYVPRPLARSGTALAVDVRGRPLPVTVVPRPFYRSPDA